MPPWLVLDEAARQFDIRLPFLETLANVGSLLLRRAVRSRVTEGVREVHTGDLERIRNEPHRRESGTFVGFGDGLENSKGEWFRTIQWAKDHLGLLFSRQSLIRFGHERTPLLGNVAFEGHLVPVYVGAGRWKEIWVFRQTQLEMLKETLMAGRAIDPSRGPGVSYGDCKDEFGLGKTILNNWHANGIPELGNQKLAKWYEWRLEERRRSGRSSIVVARTFAVFSPHQIEDALEARRKIAIAAQGAKTELTDKETMARFEGIFRDGDLYRWRDECQFLARKLRARQLPDGNWLNDLEDLEKIAKKLNEHREKGEIVRGGKTYVPLRAFLELAGYKAEQDVGKYCQGDNPRSHSALGRPVERIQVNASEKYIRRNRHPENYWYLKGDGEKIRDWRADKDAARERPIKFLLCFLAQGPVQLDKVISFGAKAGFSPDALKHARKKHNQREEQKEEKKRVLQRKIGFRGPTVWFIEGQDPEQWVEDPRIPAVFAVPNVPAGRAPPVEVTNPPSRPIPVCIVADGPTEETVNVQAGSSAFLQLMRVFTNGLADDRIEKAARLLADGNLTANEKLTKIDALIPFPATTSAEQLGNMLGVTKQAVWKTDWWIQNRKGEKESEDGRRHEGHRKRAEGYEAPDQHYDE